MTEEKAVTARIIGWCFGCVSVTAVVMIWIFCCLNAKADKCTVEAQGAEIRNISTNVELIAQKLGIQTVKK